MNTNILNITSDVLRICGPDANTYLQGQFSQNVKGPVGLAAYGLWLTEKGRVLADAHVLKLAEDAFLVVFTGQGLAAERQTLVMRNVIADDVECHEVGGNFREIALWGASAAEVCQKVLGATPPAGAYLENSGVFAFLARLAAGENFRFLVPVAAVPDWEKRLLSAGAVIADEQSLLRDRILAGIAAVPLDIGPGELPNEGGLENAAVSYTKGCYLGQEVTNRLKTMGQVRRRLHIIRGCGAVPAVHAQLHQSGRKIGEIRSAVTDGDGFVALALLTLLNLDISVGASLTPDGPADVRIERQA